MTKNTRLCRLLSKSIHKKIVGTRFGKKKSTRSCNLPQKQSTRQSLQHASSILSPNVWLCSMFQNKDMPNKKHLILHLQHTEHVANHDVTKIWFLIKFVRLVPQSLQRKIWNISYICMNAKYRLYKYMGKLFLFGISEIKNGLLWNDITTWILFCLIV